MAKGIEARRKAIEKGNPHLQKIVIVVQTFLMF